MIKTFGTMESGFSWKEHQQIREQKRHATLNSIKSSNTSLSHNKSANVDRITNDTLVNTIQRRI